MLTKHIVILISILCIAAVFRLTGVNWDQGQHLHPDERFLTMVGIDLQIPKTFSEYLDPQKSQLNPVNILDGMGNQKYAFFVYGIFPMTLNKAAAVLLNNDSYGAFTLQGRMISAFFDLLTLIAIYKIARLLEVQYKLHYSLKYFTVLLYALSVLPIQLSHFFAVDTFLNFFIVCSVYYLLRFAFSRQAFYLLAGGVSIGLAIACKISAVYVLPLLGVYFVTGIFFSRNTPHTHQKSMLSAQLRTFLLLGLLFGISAYISVRLFNPYMFEYANILNPKINTLFFQNLQVLKSWESLTVPIPPNVQWLHKTPVLFSLGNIVFWGLGISQSILVLPGMFFAVRKKNHILIILLIWVVLFFLYQSSLVVKSLRYFIFLYPFFALFGAFTLTEVYRRKKFLAAVITLILFIYPFAFLSIYTHPHSRVTASVWIYENIADGKKILTEHWDDALPLPAPMQQYVGKQYFVEQLPVFDPDTPEKWEKINVSLRTADYYILTSNRGWGSIPTAPEHYPLMGKFYADLFAGKTQYKKIREFTSYPSLRWLGIPVEFPDDSAEEAFTVYDHPKVIIFQNSRKNSK